jgi:hypothetical protein
MPVAEPKSVTIPCRFAGPCTWRYFDSKCLHRLATNGRTCPSAYKKVKR